MRGVRQSSPAIAQRRSPIALAHDLMSIPRYDPGAAEPFPRKEYPYFGRERTTRCRARAQWASSPAPKPLRQSTLRKGISGARFTAIIALPTISRISLRRKACPQPSVALAHGPALRCKV
jgi:hypothetical protein